MIVPPGVDDLLDRADAAGAAGRGADAARLYDEAISRSRQAGDLGCWTRAVLGKASAYVFGAEPGNLPAQLYDVLARTTDDADRARLAAALARCWVYAGQAARAAQFAGEAVERAQRAGSPELLAHCLDAALTACWGPDELGRRVALAARLDDVAAHVLDPLGRLGAHLWGVQVACEELDLQALRRHLRALEHLGEESPRALFFAASRRLMLELLEGRTDTVATRVGTAAGAAAGAGLPDAWMVVESMKAYAAVQAGDRATCAHVAAACEDFAVAEGAAAVCAEAAYLWVAAGRLDRAAPLVATFHREVLLALPRDVNWLLTLQCLLEAALAVGDRDVVGTAAELLAPYAGRSVVNAGAVMFHGVTDDTLARAASLLGDDEAAWRHREQALATYERIGARWWRDRLAAWTPPAATTLPPAGRAVRLHPSAGGDQWLVGRDGDGGAVAPVRGLRGFGYLRELVRRPGVPVRALDLVAGGGPSLVQGGVGETLDRRAVEAYRSRLRQLDDELAEKQRPADAARRERLQAERSALAVELSAASGLAGRSRRTGGSSDERARVAVTKAIGAAISRIAAVDEPLGRHLRTAIRTGYECCYQPEPGTAPAWLLEPDPDMARAGSVVGGAAGLR